MRKILAILALIPLLYTGSVLASKPPLPDSSQEPAYDSSSDLKPSQDKNS